MIRSVLKENSLELENTTFPSSNSSILNLLGYGASSQKLVAGLENLTFRRDLRDTTLNFLVNRVSINYLINPVRRWCAKCYQGQEENGDPVYDQLIWCLSAVNICLEHSQVLEMRCPRCRRYQSHFSGYYLSGKCTNCQSSLIAKFKKVQVQSLNSLKFVQYEIWKAVAIGGILANLRKIKNDLYSRFVYHSHFHHQALNLIEAPELSKNSRFFSYLKVLNGTNCPSLELILQMCYRNKVEPIEFLTTGYKSLQIIVKSNLEKQAFLFPGYKSANLLTIQDNNIKTDFSDSIIRFLSNSLSKPQQIPLNQLASSLNLKAWDLQVLAPHLCAQIELREMEKLQPSNSEIKQNLEKILRSRIQQKFLSLSILNELDQNESWYFAYPNLCFRIEERFLELRPEHLYGYEIPVQLLDFLFYYPPLEPAEFEEKIGLSWPYNLCAFPILQKAIALRYKSYLKFQRFLRLNKICHDLNRVIKIMNSKVLLTKQKILREIDEDVDDWEFWDLLKLTDIKKGRKILSKKRAFKLEA